MKPALVSPLPPQPGVAARLAAELLPHLQADAPLLVLTTAPEQVDAGLAETFDVRALAELPRLLAEGEVDLPIYLVADEVLHGHQLRFVQEHPGLLVLLTPGVHRVFAAITEESGDLEGYRALLVEEHGDGARGWPERFLWRVDRERIHRWLPLAGVLIRRSLGVLTPASHTEAYRRRHPGVPIETLADDGDPGAVAAGILAMARRVAADPRPVQPRPQPEWPSVEVVLVSYNSRNIVAPGLRSLRAQDYPNLTCTLVDNASADGTAEYVRETFPEIDVVEAGSNLGFAGGNNHRFARSEAKYIVLFNQDAVARPDFVRELVRVAERDPGIGVVGAKMLMMRCPTILNSTGIVMNEGGFAVDRGIGEKDDDSSPVPERVFAACGGAMLVRTAALREVGGFDEAFFMYYEDVDLCWRMRLHGLDVLYAPLAVVLHDWHGDLDGAPTKADDPPPENDARTLRRRMLCERNRMQSVIKNVGSRDLLRTLVRMRRYDRSRLRNLRAAIAAGQGAAAADLVRRAIRQANRWCRWHLPGLLLRRRRVQGLRRNAGEGVSGFIAAGVHEPYHVGDLQIVNDRFCAEAPERLQMGVNDRRALGPGWHGLEARPGEAWGVRWNKGEAWLYLAAATPATRLLARIGRGPVATQVAIRVGTQDLIPQEVPEGDLQVLAFELPVPQAAAPILEIRLASKTFRPSDTEGVDDHRLLGLRLAEIWLE